MPEQNPMLDEIRAEIDRIDAQIVALIAMRQRQVERAGKAKRSVEEVPAPDRVETVLRKVRGLAIEHGTDPTIVEKIYRTMIDAFISWEIDQVGRRDDAR